MRLRTQLISGTALLLVTAYPAAAQSQNTIKPWTGKAVILAQSSECVQDPTAEGCAEVVIPKDEPAQNADENAAKPAEPKAEEPANAAEGGKKNAEKAAKKAREKLPETDTQKTDEADEQQAEEQPVEEPDSNKTELSSETTGESEIEAESETSVESETAVESETSGEAEVSSESETIIESETSAETDASTDTDTSAGTDTPTDTETSADTETATDSETIVEQESDSDTETTVESETTSEETIETTSEEETDERDQSASEESDSDAERAPVLDSMKKGKRNRQNSAGTDEGQTQDDSQQASDKSSEPPKSDAEAQVDIDTDVESATEEEGRRVERPRDRDRRRDRDADEEVVRDMGDRIIIRFGDTFHVEWRDRDERIRRGAEEVYYEELPRGRTREVIVRRNGVKVVTIRNRHGDILHRAKIFPDGREIVLVHVDRDHYDRVRDRHRHDYDLPPLQLTIPISEYVLEAELVDDPDVYYQFLSRPPVETVERTYSIAEVTESPRIRDKVRRVDLDTINFEFGSARITDSEIDELDGIARAMKRMLDQNPGETFLIEGHTDAVGSDMVNLALSDRRAEAVVAALTEFYEIPPENLVPQGYGEQYLKVNTEDRSRENRRVAIRRITPLVAPVASTN